MSPFLTSLTFLALVRVGLMYEDNYVPAPVATGPAPISVPISAPVTGPMIAPMTAPMTAPMPAPSPAPNMNSELSNQEILTIFYHATDGDNWAISWDITREICGQYMAICDEHNRITRLDLWFNSLRGTIPAEIGGLTALEGLILYGNDLTGSIPTEIGFMTSLSAIELWDNSLMGTIPTEVGGLTALEYLLLYENDLTGSIPTEIGFMTSLSVIDLEVNCLTGSIPTEIGYLTSLLLLTISDNELSGTIPTEIGNTALTELVLLRNDITGVIPTEIGGLESMAVLTLKLNSISGSIPSEIGNIGNMYSLSLQSNDISGNIPTEIGRLSSLVNLYLYDNELTGPIPTEIGGLILLKRLYLYDNFLTGGIPTEIGNLIESEQIWLYRNSLNGSIPTEIGRCVSCFSLIAIDNFLSGTIPPEIGNMASMIQMLLHSNLLSGSIPTEVGSMTYCSQLFLHANELSGPIPTQIGLMRDFKELSLHYNLLTGTIPLEIGNLESLQQLALNNNMLEGSIPSEIGNLTELVQLSLNDNELTGAIPSELANLTLLPNLELYRNSLNGTIPTQIGEMTSLEILALFNNHLDGTIPTEIGAMTSLKEIKLQSNNLTGPIPTEVGNLKALENLYLHENELNGTMPTELGNCDVLGGLFLKFNNLIGGIPSEIRTITTLQRLYLSNNPLTCPVTSYAGWSEETDFVSYESRTTCEGGEVIAVQELHSLLLDTDKTPFDFIVMHYCEFEWLSCDSDTRQVASITLANRSLDGVIPDSIQQLTGLQNLFLGENLDLCPVDTNYSQWAMNTDYSFYAGGTFCAELDCEIEAYDSDWRNSMTNFSGASCEYVNNSDTCLLDCQEGFKLQKDSKIITCDRGDFNGGKCTEYCDFKSFAVPRRLTTGNGNDTCDNEMLPDDSCTVSCLYPHEKQTGGGVLRCGLGGEFVDLPNCLAVNKMAAIALFIVMESIAVIIVLFDYFGFFAGDVNTLVTMVFAIIDFVSTVWVIVYGFTSSLGTEWTRVSLNSISVGFLAVTVIFNLTVVVYWIKRFYSSYIKDNMTFSFILSFFGIVSVSSLLIPCSELLDIPSFSSYYSAEKRKVFRYLSVVGIVLLSVPQFVLQFLMGKNMGLIWGIYFSLAASAADFAFLILRWMLVNALNLLGRLDKDFDLRRACAKGDTDAVSNLLRANAKVNCTDLVGRTPLMYASENGKSEVFEALKGAGAELNTADKINDETALMLACKGGHEDMVTTLLENSADIAVTNKDKNTVLHLAVIHEQTHIILVLHNYIPPYELANEDGNTAFDIAVRSAENSKQLLEPLLDYFTFPQTRFVEFSDLTSPTPLGHGKFGDVFKANLRIPSTEGETLVPVVCKVPKEHSGENEWHELQTLQNLSYHPNITGLLAMCSGFEIADKLGYKKKKTAMICILREGGALDTFCATRKRLMKTSRLVFFGIEITRGVKHLHDSNYKHCDLAARNILMNRPEEFEPEDQRISVTDFGLARPMDFEHDSKTPIPVLWCPPEMLKRRNTNAATDCWMLGCTLFELTAYPYRRPFSNPLVQNADLKQHSFELDNGKKLEFHDVEKERISGEWLELILWCTEMDPKNRPSMDDLIEKMKGFKTDVDETEVGAARSRENSQPVDMLSMRSLSQYEDTNIMDSVAYEIEDAGEIKTSYDSPEDYMSLETEHLVSQDDGVYSYSPPRASTAISGTGEKEVKHNYENKAISSITASAGYDTYSSDSLTSAKYDSPSAIAIIPIVPEVELAELQAKQDNRSEILAAMEMIHDGAKNLLNSPHIGTMHDSAKDDLKSILSKTAEQISEIILVSEQDGGGGVADRDGSMPDLVEEKGTSEKT